MPKSKLFRLVPGAAALALLAACNAAPPVDAAKVGDEVKANMTEMVAAFAARDADKAVSWDAPDFVGMFHGVPNVSGQEGDRALTKEQVADPAMKFSVSNEVIDVAASGDLAVWRATYSYSFTDPATKQTRTEVGNWVVGWKRQADGTMKEAWGVVSDTPAAPAT
jgi:ketosteroid isomerase-like protein